MIHFNCSIFPALTVFRPKTSKKNNAVNAAVFHLLEVAVARNEKIERDYTEVETKLCKAVAPGFREFLRTATDAIG